MTDNILTVEKKDEEDRIKYETFISKFLKEHRYSYVRVDNMKSLKKIYKIYSSNDISKMKKSTDGIIYNYIGCYHVINKDNEMALWNFEKGADLGCIYSMMNAASMYKRNNDNDKMIKYYAMAADKGHREAISDLSKEYRGNIKYCNDINDIKYRRLLLQSYNLLNNITYLEILIEHCKSTDNDEDVEKHYLIGINDGYKYLILDLANYYRWKGNHDKSDFYYLKMCKEYMSESILKIAFSTLSSNTLESIKTILFEHLESGKKGVYTLIGKYYESIDDVENMKKYYLLGCKEGDQMSIKLCNAYIKSQPSTSYTIDCFPYLDKYNKRQLLIKYIKHLEFIDMFKSMESIVKKSEECFICCTDNKHIELNCGHTICIMCYKEVDKCPLCRESI